MTIIAFDLPEAEHVEIGVYDAAGRLVKEILSGDVPAGSHTVEWHGTDEAGIEMGPGIYFVQIEAGDFEDTRKMIRVQ